ncbi:glycosyltransferase family 20-domain-containing protein [Spinellus fusiger]|nr:glycosyltransferase family 20-domain-containing protein [Spinellus fusiger]
MITELTAEKVAHFLPLSGHLPHIQGRIINVTHQIPYNIRRSAKPCHLRKDNGLETSVESTQIAEQMPIHAATATTASASATTAPASAASAPAAPAAPAPAPAAPAPAPAPAPDPAQGAPVSGLARHHPKGKTLRVKFSADDWTVVERRGHAALYAGVHSLGKSWEAIHIGWTGPIQVKISKKTIPPEEIAHEDKAQLQKLLWETGHIVPIFLDNKSHGHYEGYCKQILWPIFHYVVWSNSTNGQSEKSNWEDYVAVNRQFADTIIETYRPGDIIYIHDYHLLLVPEMIRASIPDAPVGLFFHATFPSSEILRCLTTRNEILQGMLGANLVGFQTYSYARHFISSCTRVLGCESTQVGINSNGQVVSVGAFPIGIDVDRVYKFYQQPGVNPKMNAIRDTYAGKKIIVGRDKLDSTKGVLQKLYAFEKFLTDYPEWRNKVVLIQVATPTFGDHSKLETKVSEVVSHINGLYGSLEFTPVHYYHQDIDRDEYYALLSAADVGLITCVRDGMNTTSFEYIICQEKTHNPLILSEFAGTAGSLSAAILINPWDYAEVAKALNDALLMSPEEKDSRHMKLYKHVTNHTASYWAHSFVRALVSCTEKQIHQSHSTPTLNMDSLESAYRVSQKRLMFFDYDGTLTPIVSLPSDAKPSDKMLASLQKLCLDPYNIVWIISGRDQATLDEWLGSKVKNIGLSAEHGCYLKPPGASSWSSMINNVDISWKQDVIKIFDYYTERTQGSFVEHKKSSITWHYRNADTTYGAFQAKECQNHLENTIVSKLPVEILVGKKNLEVRPLFINKGEIVKRILSQNPDANLVICAGDDKTDEDMFRTLSTAYNKSTNGQPQSPTSEIASTLYPYIYTDINNWPCVRLLNATGTIGCHALYGSSGILYQVLSQVELNEFVDSYSGSDEFYTIVLPYHLLTNDNIHALDSTRSVGGVVTLLRGSLLVPEGSFASLDTSCPNCQYGLYAKDPDQYIWNPQAQGILEENLPFPVFGINPIDGDSINAYNAIMKAIAYNIQRRYTNYPLQSMDIQLFMWSAINSETCLRRVGGASVYSSPSHTISAEDGKKIIVLTAPLDSRSLFHDLTDGINNPLSGLIAMLTVADALSRSPLSFESLKKNIVYTAFTAEAWGFAGSQRFVQDITTPFQCTNATRAFPCPYTNAPCTNPCIRSMNFQRIQFNNIDTIIEFSSVSGINSNYTGYWAHVDAIDQTKPLVDMLQQMNLTLPGPNANPTIQSAYGNSTLKKLPPSSAMSFLSKRRDINAVVLSDYQTELGK